MEEQTDFCRRLPTGTFFPWHCYFFDRDFQQFLNQSPFRTPVGPALANLSLPSKNKGADLNVLNLSKKVQDLLQLTKFYTVFDIYDDETIAIASFK